MTTNKESTDSGAGAINRCEIQRICKRFVDHYGDDKMPTAQDIQDLRALCDFAYTRAQDSGQGEAVAFTTAEGIDMLRRNRISDRPSSAVHVKAYCYAQGAWDVPLYTHPPKPAQDAAAGKGVDEVGVAVNCTVCRKRKQPIGRDAPLGSYMCNPHDCEGYRQDPQPGDLWPGETREQFGYGSKLAPACEKYREPTLADAHKVRHAYLNCEGVTTLDEDMLTAIQSIGAVVPAQDGES